MNEEQKQAIAILEKIKSVDLKLKSVNLTLRKLGSHHKIIKPVNREIIDLLDEILGDQMASRYLFEGYFGYTKFIKDINQIINIIETKNKINKI